MFGGVTFPYYVSADEGGTVRLLVGPFPGPEQALAWIAPAQDELLFRGEIDAAVRVSISRVLKDIVGARPGELNPAFETLAVTC